MKKNQSYWVLILALLLSGGVKAEVRNYIGAYANLGEWTLLPQESKYSASFGVAGGLGCQYELQAGRKYRPTRFLFDVGVGLQAGLTSFMQSSNVNAVLENQTDLDGWSFDYVYEMSDRRDQYTNYAVQVPLMIGVQYRKFYMLAGAKLNANIYTQSHSKANLTTYGRYKEVDDLRNMPEYQFFNDRKVTGGVKTGLKMDVDVCLEIGGRFGYYTEDVGYDVPKRRVEMRLAGYIDYGLLDIHYRRDQLALGMINPENKDQILPLEYMRYNQGATYPVYNTTSMVDNLVMNDIMSTSGFAKAVNSMVVGLKFTILFQLPELGQCVICRDAYGSSVRSRGSGGAKYEE